MYLKFLVYLHECAEFDETWSSRLNFISTETETTQVRNRFGILQFFGHPICFPCPTIQRKIICIVAQCMRSGQHTRVSFRPFFQKAHLGFFCIQIHAMHIFLNIKHMKLNLPQYQQFFILLKSWNLCTRHLQRCVIM